MVLGGHDDETLSSRLGRAAQRGSLVGRAGSWVLNTISAGHTEGAETNDMRRAKLVIEVIIEDAAAEKAAAALLITAANHGATSAIVKRPTII